MGRRRRGVGSDDDGIAIIGLPDWQSDPRLQWKARDWFAWALWAAQSPRNLLEADRLPRGRWSRRARGLQRDPLIPQETLTATRWWDLRFELALFALASTGMPLRTVSEHGWRIIPVGRRVEMMADDKEMSFRSVMIIATGSSPRMPTEQEALHATRKLHKLLKDLVSGQEVRYCPVERIGRWEVGPRGEGFVFRPADAPQSLGTWRALVTESFWALATQFAPEMAQCKANGCGRWFLEERRGHHFCSETCEERAHKRVARRRARARTVGTRRRR